MMLTTILGVNSLLHRFYVHAANSVRLPRLLLQRPTRKTFPLTNPPILGMLYAC